MAPSRASAVREDGGEASVGVVQAGLLSREIGEVSGRRRTVDQRKTTPSVALSRVAGGPRAV